MKEEAHNSKTSGNSLICRDNTTIGQWVYILQPAQSYLTMCEVEVFGVPAQAQELEENIALDKSSWQTSVYSSYKSSYANDGNFDVNLGSNSCAMMNNAIRNWWAADLEKSYQFNRVVLTNSNSSRKFLLL